MNNLRRGDLTHARTIRLQHPKSQVKILQKPKVIPNLEYLTIMCLNDVGLSV